jgi:(R,R)-butanediol dehydrogenase / meso-butanediol dehydrogenase / diacetyl reductase
MKALRWHARKDLQVDTVEEPKAEAGNAIVEVAWCGICGTDLHEYLAGPVFIPTQPHPLSGRMAPLTLGHEFSGRVVEVGKGVKGVRVGDRVTADACVKCGTCWYCRHGYYVLCDRLAFLGLMADGGLAPYVAVPDYALHKLPDSMSDEEGALVEPLSVAVHAVRRGRVMPGDSVAIVGAGPIGLATLLAARSAGAGEVFVVELAAARKQKAVDNGATKVIDPADGDPITQIRDLTGGLGVDISFECVGHKNTVPLTVGLARKGGRVVIVGVFEEASSLNFNEVGLAEREIIGSLAYVDDFPRSISLIADHRIHAAPLITAKTSLDNAVEQGFDQLVTNKDQHIKILINPRKA